MWGRGLFFGLLFEVGFVFDVFFGNDLAWVVFVGVVQKQGIALAFESDCVGAVLGQGGVFDADSGELFAQGALIHNGKCLKIVVGPEHGECPVCFNYFNGGEIRSRFAVEFYEHPFADRNFCHQRRCGEEGTHCKKQD